MKTIESRQPASAEDEKPNNTEALSPEAPLHFELTRVSASEARRMTPEQKSDFVESAKKQIASHLRELRKICESNLGKLETESEGFQYFKKEIEKIDKQIFRYEDTSRVRKLKSISKAEAGLNEAYTEYENKMSGFGKLSKKTRNGRKDKREAIVKNNTSDTDVSVGEVPRTEFADKSDASMVANDVSDNRSIEQSAEDDSIDWSLEPEPESEDSVGPGPTEVENGEEKNSLARIVTPEQRDVKQEESVETQKKRDALDMATAREQLKAVEEAKDFPITGGVSEHSSLKEELGEERSDDSEAVPDNNSQTKKEIEYIRQEVIKEAEELKSLRDEIKSLARGSGWIKALKVTWELTSIFGAVAIDAPWLIDMNAAERLRAEDLEKVKDSYRKNWKKLKEKKEKVLALKKELEQAKEEGKVEGLSVKTEAIASDKEEEKIERGKIKQAYLEETKVVKKAFLDSEKAQARSFGEIADRQTIEQKEEHLEKLRADLEQARESGDEERMENAQKLVRFWGKRLERHRDREKKRQHIKNPGRWHRALEWLDKNVNPKLNAFFDKTWLGRSILGSDADKFELGEDRRFRTKKKSKK